MAAPLPRIKTSIFLLSICNDELISVPNIITYLPNPFTLNEENFQPEYLYLSKSSSFLVNLTASNKNFQTQNLYQQWMATNLSHR